MTGRPLGVRHAFHSRHADPLVEEFTKLVASVPAQAPAVTVVSTLTGRALTPEEARSPEYWARQMRRTVRFADALAALPEGAVLVEAGPGQALSGFARRSPGAERLVLPSLYAPDTGAPQGRPPARLTAVAGLWERGWPSTGPPSGSGRGVGTCRCPVTRSSRPATGSRRRAPFAATGPFPGRRSPPVPLPSGPQAAATPPRPRDPWTRGCACRPGRRRRRPSPTRTALPVRSCSSRTRPGWPNGSPPGSSGRAPRSTPYGPSPHPRRPRARRRRRDRAAARAGARPRGPRSLRDDGRRTGRPRPRDRHGRLLLGGRRPRRGARRPRGGGAGLPARPHGARRAGAGPERRLPRPAGTDAAGQRRGPRRAGPSPPHPAGRHGHGSGTRAARRTARVHPGRPRSRLRAPRRPGAGTRRRRGPRRAARGGAGGATDRRPGAGSPRARLGPARAARRRRDDGPAHRGPSGRRLADHRRSRRHRPGRGRAPRPGRRPHAAADGQASGAGRSGLDHDPPSGAAPPPTARRSRPGPWPN